MLIRNETMIAIHMEGFLELSGTELWLVFPLCIALTLSKKQAITYEFIAKEDS